MSDLGWVTKLATASPGDPAVQAMLDNPGWKLLHVTGGLHTPIKYVFGWPAHTEDEDMFGDMEHGQY